MTYCLFALLVATIAAQCAWAQDNPDFEIGLKPYGSYHMGNIDTVSLGNGSLSVDIPLISYPQRGGKLALDFHLQYFNSSSYELYVCYTESFGTECVYEPFGTQGGFAITDKQAFTWGQPSGSPCSIINSSWEFCSLPVQNTDGASHLMAPINEASTLYRSLDASGILGTSSSNSSVASAYIDSDGTTHTNVSAITLNGGVISDTREDANGNEITYSSTAGWTDTMGREIAMVPAAGSSGLSSCPAPPNAPLTATSASVWTLPGLGGGNYTITLCYASVAYTHPYSGSMTELQSVVLPNGKVWTFAYTQSSLSYIPILDLSELTFPTGGTLSYTWTGSNVCQNSGVYASVNEAVLNRTMNPVEGASSEWSYSIASTGTTVTDPASNVSVHTFGFGAAGTQNGCEPYENQVKYYSASGTLLKTTDTTYSSLLAANWWNTPPWVYLNVVPIQVNTIWPNNSNQENQISYTYDSGATFIYPYYGYNGSTVTLSQSGNPYYSTGTEMYGKQLTKSEYDYGNGSPGSLLRTTTTSWLALNNSNYLTYNLLDLPSSVQVSGSGPGSSTTYSYDQYNPLGQSGITTQHVTPPNGNYRGNLTSTSRWLNGSTVNTGNCQITVSNGYLTNYKTYNDTGTVATSVDSCGISYTDPNHTTSYTYSSTYVGALVTQTQYPTTNGVNHITSAAYDFNTGLMTSSTDQNSLTTTYQYDQMLRTLQIDKPDGGQALFCYTDTGTESGGATCTQSSPPYDVVITETINSSANRGSILQVDGVGREIRQAVTNGENGYDEVDTCYDGDGRVSFKSYSYQTSSPSGTRCSNSTTPGDSYLYDGLNRNCLLVPSDGTQPSSSTCPTTQPADTVFTTYSGNSTTVTDEQGKTRERFMDGLGRLTEVIENPSGLNYATNYAYDALNNLTSVVQNSSRNRSFVYDSLSHLTSSTNPESNWSPTNQSYVATTYAYDAGGNLINKTEPAQNQQGTATVTLTYCYDFLNRMIAKAYTSQPCTSTLGSMANPLVSYVYDGQSLPSVPSGCTLGSFSYGKAVGKRTAMCEGTGEVEGWSYNITAGQGWQTTDQRTTNSLTKTAVYQNNFLGLPASIQYPSGRTISYNYNAAGRPTSALDGTTSVYYANTAHYWANGTPCWMVYGAAITGATTFNGRSQPLEMQSTGSVVTYPGSGCPGLGSTGNLLDLNYNFNYGSSDNGNVMGITNNRDTTRSQSFLYDALNRITSAQTASTYSTSPTHCWGETYQFDGQTTGGAWGNLTAITPMTGNYTGCSQESGLSVTATAQNQISNGSTYGYDTAGNMTTNGSNTYNYDAENHLTSTAGVNYTYDGDGKRIEKSNGKIYWYGIEGNILDETDLTGSTNNTAFSEYVFFAKSRIGRHDSSNNVYYYASDQLGTSRVIAEVPSGSTTATLCYDGDFYPFGGERAYTNNCSQNYKFTGKERDSESALDNFEARYNASVIGRFMSADPVTLKGNRLLDPQRWNLYTYARNNPLGYLDPDGQDAIAIAFTDYKARESSIRVPFTGHGGLLVFDSTGKGKYYEYGRYDAAEKGVVKSTSVQLEIKDGKATDASIKATLKAIAEQEKYSGKITGDYFKTTDKQAGKIEAYADGRENQNNDPNRKPYNSGVSGVLMGEPDGNNCGTFVRDALAAGGIDTSAANSDIRPAAIVDDLEGPAYGVLSFNAGTGSYSYFPTNYNINTHANENEADAARQCLQGNPAACE